MREYSDSVVEDYVIRTDPVAGTELEAGTTVLLYVSQGPKINKVSVPSLVGLTEDEARRSLNEVGLVASTALVPGDKAYGTVLTQNIAPDQQVDEGTIINLEISDGSSAPVQKEITVTFPKSPASFTLTVKKSGEVAYEATHSAEEKSVRIVLSGRGTEIVEIYINGVLKESGFVDFT
jgi:serine/threonine-protein kinase